MKQEKYFLSIVVPIFNESKRIHKLTDFQNFINKTKFKIQLVLVNDGSTDNTLLKIKNVLKGKKFKLVNYQVNKGKGYALKKGMLAAEGKYILFTDLDLSTPLFEIKKFLPYLKTHHVVIGTRKSDQAKLLARQPIIREYLGKGFTNLSRLILQLNLSDFTCGFKCFQKEAAHDIFSRVSINRWGFDAEVLFISKIKKYKIKEVPVIWQNDLQTKVKFPQDIFNSFIELIKIRTNAFQGKYN